MLAINFDIGHVVLKDGWDIDLMQTTFSLASWGQILPSNLEASGFEVAS